jgi:predicted O-methyltransferase YrrM
VPKSLVKRAIARGARTSIGKHVIHAALAPEVQAERFSQVRAWPETIAGFEDLAFLFTSSQTNHGIASLRFDEAALLYRLGRGVASGTIVEIGRFKGGSTVVFASAMGPGVSLWSYDLHVPLRSDLSPATLDAELAAALERFDLGERVQLVVADSRTVALPPGPVEVLFVDGDHSYSGARADVDRWGALVREGGHLVLHDAVVAGTYGNIYPGVARVVSELGHDARWTRLEDTGSIAHFVRTA